MWNLTVKIRIPDPISLCNMYNKIIVILFIILLLPFIFFSTAHSKEAGEDYIIGPEDVLHVTVWDNEDLSSKVAVSLEGFINFHLIGKIKASGLTTAELAEEITHKLKSGYINNPQVTIQVIEYKSQKVFIIGEANKPGTYYLTKKTTLIEAISMAGGLRDAGREVIVVRPKKKGKSRDYAPSSQAEEGEQIKVDIRSALEGDLSQNIYIHNGDSIFIPKAQSFFIMGEVNSPGKYSLEKGTTILKAISMGGGTTAKAAMGRTKVVRVVEGKEVKIKVNMDEFVQPNDAIIVPESFF
ncbi:MAG: polysaccharide biosynthesis/export family protein [bacterium]